MPTGVYTHPLWLNRRVRPILFVIGPSIAYVQLTRGKYALIESDDAHLVWGRNWCAAPHHQEDLFYAISRERKTLKTNLMHCTIMGTRAGKEIDHANRNGLDNRRHGNLRRATKSQNRVNSKRRCDNKTGFKGVTINRNKKRKFQANIQWAGKQYYLGAYETPEEAAAVVREKAKDLHGEFARSG